MYPFTWKLSFLFSQCAHLSQYIENISVSIGYIVLSCFWAPGCFMDAHVCSTIVVYTPPVLPANVRPFVDIKSMCATETLNLGYKTAILYNICIRSDRRPKIAKVIFW